MKNGDVLVDRMSSLTFYTIITDKDRGMGIRVAIDNEGQLYEVSSRGYFDTNTINASEVLLACPVDVPFATKEEVA